MRLAKRVLPIIMAAVMAAGGISGCSQRAGNSETAAAGSQTETAISQAGASSEDTGEEKGAEASAEREITDMAGRKVTVPSEIDTVFSAGSVSAIYLYTLAPDKLLNWNYDLNAVEKSIILEKYQSLPNLGMGDAINYEAVIAAGPSIALNVGKINDKFISDCDKLSDSLGIPVVAADADLTASPEVYRFLGERLGMEDEAEELAIYAEKTFRDIDQMNVPEDKRVRVYFGNGEDSLETAPAGSAHGQALDMVKAVNVAQVETADGSRVQISPEQLLAWNPDVILVNGEPKADLSGASAAETLLNNPDYASLKAVQEKKVYGTPNAPFSWVDRPQGPNRIVGLRWLSGLLYPEYLNMDVDQEVKEFFRLFYHVELTEEQLQKVYNGTI